LLIALISVDWTGLKQVACRNCTRSLVVLAALYVLNARGEAGLFFLLDRLCQIKIPEFVGWMLMADKNLAAVHCAQ
jgi:hypothetical protein